MSKNIQNVLHKCFTLCKWKIYFANRARKHHLCCIKQYHAIDRKEDQLPEFISYIYYWYLAFLSTVFQTIQFVSKKPLHYMQPILFRLPQSISVTYHFHRKCDHLNRNAIVNWNIYFSKHISIKNRSITGKITVVGSCRNLMCIDQFFVYFCLLEHHD